MYIKYILFLPNISTGHKVFLPHHVGNWRNKLFPSFSHLFFIRSFFFYYSSNRPFVSFFFSSYYIFLVFFSLQFATERENVKYGPFTWTIFIHIYLFICVCHEAGCGSQTSLHFHEASALLPLLYSCQITYNRIN